MSGTVNGVRPGGVLELAELGRKRKELDQHSGALAAQRRQLEARAQKRIELTEIAHSIEKFCEQVNSGLSGATFEQKRSLVELLIDRVVVTDEEVEIRYVVPTSPDGPHHPFCHLRTDYQDSFPGRKVVGQQSPCTTTTDYIEDGVEDLAQRVNSGTPASLRSRQVRFDVVPFSVR